MQRPFSHHKTNDSKASQSVHRQPILLLSLLILLVLAGCARLPRRLPANANPRDTTSLAVRLKPGQLLSAFFGLDKGLPQGANLAICPGAGQADGMPVIFATEVDPNTVQAGDFQIQTRSGKTGQMVCVTLMPAVDPGELRTVLLVGEFGSASQDPPVRVKISGHLLSADHSLDYSGASIQVTPLSAGPSLVWAEVVPQDQWQTGQTQAAFGSGTGCPPSTRSAVRVVWSGGVKGIHGQEAGEVERQLYQVSLHQGRQQRTLVPFALADLGDGDNNHLLCLDQEGLPGRVSFPAGSLRDPNQDLNPATAVMVSPLSP